MWFIWVNQLCWRRYFLVILFSPELKVLSTAVLSIPPLNLYPVLVLRLFSQDCAGTGHVLKSSSGQQQPRWEISRVLLHKVQSFRGIQDILLGEKSLERLFLQGMNVPLAVMTDNWAPPEWTFFVQCLEKLIIEIRRPTKSMSLLITCIDSSSPSVAEIPVVHLKTSIRNSIKKA